MTRTTRIPIAVTSSTTVAVASDPIYVGGNKMSFHVYVAGAALVDLEGSLDGTNWVDLNSDNVAGAYTLTAINNVAAGTYHEVHERPEYVRMLVEIDAGGPRTFYGLLLVKKESG